MEYIIGNAYNAELKARNSNTNDKKLTTIDLYNEKLSEIACVAQKLKKGWKLSNNAFSDGHRLTVTLEFHETLPATQKQANSKKKLYWNPNFFTSLPKVEEPKNRIELAAALNEIANTYEIIGVDPGVKEVLTWCRQNKPGFYSLKKYRQGFGLDVNQKRRAYMNMKQRNEWLRKYKRNFFDELSQTSLKQTERETMKQNIQKIKPISDYLFAYFQSGFFNRLNFWLFKRRQAGLEKIVRLMMKGRTTPKSSKQKKGMSKMEWLSWFLPRFKRKQKLARRWKKITKELEDDKKRREQEKKDREEKESKKEENQEQKEEAKPSKKKRLATAARREKRKKQNKTWIPRSADLDVDWDRFSDLWRFGLEKSSA